MKTFCGTVENGAVRLPRTAHVRDGTKVVVTVLPLVRERKPLAGYRPEWEEEDARFVQAYLDGAPARDTRAHHARTDGGRNARRQIEHHVRQARTEVLAGRRAEAAYSLGLALHYVADWHIPSARKKDEHDRAERDISQNGLREGIYSRSAMTQSEPDERKPLASLDSFLDASLDGGWRPALLRETLVCCLATARAVLLPASSEQWCAEITARLRRADEGMLTQDSCLANQLRSTHAELRKEKATLRWWQFIRLLRHVSGWGVLEGQEHAYTSRSALRSRQAESQEHIDAGLRRYRDWFTRPGEEPKVTMPPPQWGPVWDLARSLGIRRRQAEVILAASSGSEDERLYGCRWVEACDAERKTGFLRERLKCCRLSGHAEGIGSGCLTTYCGYCGERIYFRDPGPEKETTVECFNGACPERIRY
ncbi:MAG: hypothetical protein FJ291_00650 [Planctomycetes bacterium]|nr:hypothetical protein [Planctomycetota bacterium]